MTLVTTQKILAYTKGLSIKLQARYIDAVRAHSDIESVKSILRRCRSEVLDFHQRVYEEAVQLGTTVDVEQSAPRLAGRQQHRHNVPATSATDYYKLNLTIPLLDHLLTELDNRFNSESSAIIIEFLQLLPAAIYNKSVSETLTFTKVLNLYEDDLPSSRSLDTELDMWQAKWRVCDANLAVYRYSSESPTTCRSGLLSKYPYTYANHGDITGN